jgi:hypothetical protein
MGAVLMEEVTRYLYLAAAAPYVILGMAHAWATPCRPDQRKGVAFTDPDLAGRMAGSALLITRRTNAWLAWVGFNFSHSLGLVLFGAVVVLTGRSRQVFALEAPLFLPLALVVSVCYSGLAIRYWFRTPIAGTAASFLLFLASSVLWWLGWR